MKASSDPSRVATEPRLATVATGEIDRDAAAWLVWTRRVLPHEWAFNGFLLCMALRLGAHGTAAAAGCATIFLAMLAGSIGFFVWADADPTPTRWRLRLLWYPSIMGLSFYVLPAAVSLLAIPNADRPLAEWDQALLGAPAADLLAGLQGPLLTDVMAIAYSFFFWYLIFGPAHYCLHDLRRFRSCFAGLFTVYALGFLGYMLVPAGGPHLFAAASPPLASGPIGALVLPPIDAASNGVDAFPSVHVAVTLYLLAFDARHYRRRFRWTLLPCVALWISTVYLRYHYVVDVAAGALIGLMGFAVACQYERSALAETVDADTLP
jgi:hypothetical protein